MIAISWLGCHPQKPSSHTGTPDDTERHTGATHTTPPPPDTGPESDSAPECGDRPVEPLEPFWTTADDPCAVVSTLLLKDTLGCNHTVWFDEGKMFVKYPGAGPPGSIGEYRCVAEGTVAVVDACLIFYEYGVDGPTRATFDLATGRMQFDGSEYYVESQGWQPHSGTLFGYWFGYNTDYVYCALHTGIGSHSGLP